MPTGILADAIVFHVQDKELCLFSLDENKDIVKKELGVALGRVFARAVNDLLCGSAEGLVSLVTVADRENPRITFQARVDGPVWQMLAADQKLFVVTENGGYALVVGAETDVAVSAVIRHSGMHTVVVDPVEAEITALRQRMHTQGMYGSRVSAIVADPVSAGLPPCLAELIIADESVALSKAAVTQLYESLRPYGGTAFLPARYASLVKELQLPQAEVAELGSFVRVQRQGALPGSAGWTDEYADAGSLGSDRSWDEVGKGVSVFKAADGTLVWQDLNLEYHGPLMLYHDQFISNDYTGQGFSLLTGKPLGWSWKRQYGCNTATASEHLLLFRSGSASYYDLKNRGARLILADSNQAALPA